MPAKIYTDDSICSDCCRTKKETRTYFAKGLCKVCYAKMIRHTNPAAMKKHRLKSEKSRKKPGYKKWHREHQRKRSSTILGYLEGKYTHMYMRVKGKTKHHSKHVWMGLPICSRKDFYEWALKDPSFRKLFARSQKNKKNPKLWVSIDRIDNRLGYVTNNMRFTTHQNNSRKNNKHL